MIFDCRWDVPCAKWALIVTNAAFVAVSVAMIVITEVSQRSLVIANANILAGLQSSFIFLLVISSFGLASVYLEHDATLFFYIVVMFPMFTLQFAIACACVATDSLQQEVILEAGWHRSGRDVRASFQRQFQCCGLRDTAQVDEPLGHPPCRQLDCCIKSSSMLPHLCCTGNDTIGSDSCPCGLTCLTPAKRKFNLLVKLSGSFGLLTSFADVAAIIMAVEYRKLKDPSSDLRRLF